MSTPSDEWRRGRSAAALAAGFTLMTALLLAGCADRATPVSTSSPVSETSPASGTSGNSVGSGRSGDSVTVDPKAADSIQDSVTEAESLLKELDQDFQADDTDAD